MYIGAEQGRSDWSWLAPNNATEGTCMAQTAQHKNWPLLLSEPGDYNMPPQQPLPNTFREILCCPTPKPQAKSAKLLLLRCRFWLEILVFSLEPAALLSFALPNGGYENTSCLFPHPETRYCVPMHVAGKSQKSPERFVERYR